MNWDSNGNFTTTHNLSLPAVHSEAFAEFYGALMGDGCIYYNEKSLCITCNLRTDRQYVEKWLVPMCKSLFNIEPRIYLVPKEGVIRLIINCIQLTSFLTNIGFPKGKKNGKLFIPDMFFRNKRQLAACIRGLFDTDGCISAHPHTRIMVDICSADPELLNSIHRALRILGIKFGMSPTKVQCYNKGEIRRFFSVVGSSNPKNIIKYHHFITTGKVPLAADAETLLREWETCF